MSVNQLLEEAKLALRSCESAHEVEQIRLDYLGKKGKINRILRGIGKLPEEERKPVAVEANQAKQSLNQLIEERRQAVADRALQLDLQRQKIDVSLPGLDFPSGGLHPISQTIEDIENLFASNGYEVVEGAEIEDDFHNFTALNIAPNHPARTMHDTFYFNADLVLRTHTSAVQIRELEKGQLPLKIIAPGRVYRCDSDQTHTPMFHQVEGLFIDQNLTFTDLIHQLARFLMAFFNDNDLRIRFRPSYFPFTEPSAEVDIAAQQLGGDDWLEVLGCGMVHPNVLQNVGVDSTKWKGYAFGMGVERLAMLRYGINDLRQFFTNDLRFLNQFT